MEISKKDPREEYLLKLIDRLEGAKLFTKREDGMSSVCPVRHEDVDLVIEELHHLIDLIY